VLKKGIMKKVMAMIMALVLVFGLGPMSVMADVDDAMAAARTAVAAVENATIAQRQAAINTAVSRINDALGAIEDANEAVIIANEAIMAACDAAARVREADADAQSALQAAAANETAFNTAFTSFIAPPRPVAEANALIAQQATVTTAWNAFVTAQNTANTAANNAAQALRAMMAASAGASAAQVNTYIAAATAAQANADTLFQAWLDAEAAFVSGVPSALTTVAENRKETREAVAETHMYAIEALIDEIAILIDAAEAIENANLLMDGDLAAFVVELNELWEELVEDWYDVEYTITTGGGGSGTFSIANQAARDAQQNPDPALPLHYTYITAVRAIQFRPDLTTTVWPENIPFNMLQWNQAITFLVESSTQHSLGAGGTGCWKHT